jgi:hypothetical protein
MAAPASVPTSFSNGTTADAVAVNADFAALVSWINTNAVHLDGSKPFTAVPSGPASDPVSGDQLTRKTYVDSQYGKIPVYTSATRPAHQNGLIIKESDTGYLLQSTGSVWAMLLGSATSTTPTINNVNVGTGGSAARRSNWSFVGSPSGAGILTYDLSWTLGTTGSAVTGNPGFSSPAGFTADTTIGTSLPVGQLHISNSAGGIFMQGTIRRATASTFNSWLYLPITTGTAQVRDQEVFVAVLGSWLPGDSWNGRAYIRGSFTF